jgi:hypothetical protein
MSVVDYHGEASTAVLSCAVLLEEDGGDSLLILNGSVPLIIDFNLTFILP